VRIVFFSWNKNTLFRYYSVARSVATTMNGIDDHLAAALAAAAELAKNNGSAFLFNAPPALLGLQQQQSLKASPVTAAAASLAPPPLTIPPSIAALLSAAATGSSPAETSSKQQTYGSDEDASENEEDEEEDAEDDAGSNNEVDAERRIARSRERNREHARKTRLRKKAQLQALQSKVKGLQAEAKVLKQSLEECSIASILVGLSSGERDATIQALLKEANAIENKEIFQVVAGKRKRFLSDASSSSSERLTPAQQVLEIKVGGQTIKVGGGRSQINWKSGLYLDEDGVQRQLTNAQLECLR
jgi:bZIP transcription factor